MVLSISRLIWINESRYIYIHSRPQHRQCQDSTTKFMNSNLVALINFGENKHPDLCLSSFLHTRFKLNTFISNFFMKIFILRPFVYVHAPVKSLNKSATSLSFFLLDFKRTLIHKIVRYFILSANLCFSCQPDV